MDVWNYIKRENIEIPSLYFAHEREVVWRQDSWIPNSEFLILEDHEEIVTKKIRFRTLRDITITGGIESDADTLKKLRMKFLECGKQKEEIEVMISDLNLLWKIENDKDIFNNSKNINSA